MRRAHVNHAQIAALIALSLSAVRCTSEEEPEHVVSAGGGGPTSSSSAASTGGAGAAGGEGAAGGAGGTGEGGTGATGGTGGRPCVGGKLSTTLEQPWYGDNAARLDEMIAAKGCQSPSFDPDAPPVAMFDWDNTVIKNDVGDAVMFWMLAHDLVLAPTNWVQTSQYLTQGALTALAANCPLTAPGQPLTGAACADEIFSIYATGLTTAGEAAFGNMMGKYRKMEPAYAWAAQLQAGYTAAEVRAFAAQAIDENLKAPEDDVQTIGTKIDVTHWVQIYEPIKNLITTMQNNGFDVWVVSASAQPVVEVFADLVGIDASHVIGIRLIDNGKLTYDIEGCGIDQKNDVITYIEGKRCWINKVVYGNAGPDASLKNPDPSKRQVFAAGDSDTDISFLQDATTLKLVINRNKKELMCNAYWDVGGSKKWLVNPMFIQPKGELVAGYPCATTACKTSDGVGGPCSDEQPVSIPDQTDSVFCVGGDYCPPTIP